LDELLVMLRDFSCARSAQLIADVRLDWQEDNRT
jgi:hypothetical protein